MTGVWDQNDGGVRLEWPLAFWQAQGKQAQVGNDAVMLLACAGDSSPETSSGWE